MNQPITPSPRFFDTWLGCRDAFVAALTRHGGAQGSIEIQPGYTLDYGWTGSVDAPRVLVYSSGLHGIEGFVGSAVQRELLSLDEDVAVLWLHSLNPWGMAHGRRANEGNVDLNRNFLAEGQPFAADDAAYLRLDSLLNPHKIGLIDPFYLHAGLQIARHGLPTIRNGVARGQYSRPLGIFYGGQHREATTVAVTEQVLPMLAGRERVVWIDLHSGRGARGDVVAFLDGAPSAAQGERASAAFGGMLHAWEPGSELGYEMRGGMLPELARRHAMQAPPDSFDALTVEFGTATDIAILKAMRTENWLFHHGPAGERAGQAGPRHRVRRAMRAAFAPDDPAWQRGVLDHGRDVHRRAQLLLGADSGGA